MFSLKRYAPAVALACAACSSGSGGSSSSSSSPLPAPGQFPLKYTGPATRPQITTGDLMTRLYLYADDSMMGRESASPFHAKATDYIEREVRRMGLEPAGEDGTFFQYPLVNRVADPAQMSIRVDGRTFTLWRDYAPRDGGNGTRPFDGLQVVYGGSIGDTARMIPRGSEAGKIVLLTLGRNAAGARDYDAVNRNLLTQRFIQAAAIAVDFVDHVPPGYIEENFMQPGLAVRGRVFSRPMPTYFYTSTALSRAMMGSDPEQATPGATGRTVNGSLRFSDSRGTGRNVVALLRGSDPALRNQYVVIGAHNDHVGFFNPGAGRFVDHDSVRIFNRMFRRQGVEEQPRAITAEENARFRAALDSAHARNGGPRNDSIANGADDDGSGTVGLLEIAEMFASQSNRPRRSILFVWHVGEERGMLGSGYFTDHPTVPRDSIVAQLNIDMIGRGGPDDITGVTASGQQISGGPGYLQAIGSRRLSTELGDLAESVNTSGNFGLRFDYSLDANGHPQNIYCRSDHYSYARYGIPIAFFTTGGHSDYHQVSDEPQYIDYNRLERVSSFVAALGRHVANLDHRVVVDKPKPEDPQGPCRQ